MFFSHGADEKFEAWIENPETGKRLPEHQEEYHRGTPGQSPSLHCFAECVDNTPFQIVLQRNPTNKTTSAFQCRFFINGRQVRKHAWLKDDPKATLSSITTARGLSAPLLFAPMELSYDVDDQPKDLSTVGTIEVIITPGTLIFTECGRPTPVSDPTQKGKPKIAKMGTTTKTGSERRSGPTNHYDFKASSSEPCMTLRWKYRNRIKLVLMDIIEDPLVKAIIPRGLSGETSRKRGRSETEEDDGKDPDISEEPSGSEMQGLERTLERYQDKIKRLKTKMVKAAPIETIDLTGDDDDD